MEVYGRRDEMVLMDKTEMIQFKRNFGYYLISLLFEAEVPLHKQANIAQFEIQTALIIKHHKPNR